MTGSGPDCLVVHLERYCTQIVRCSIPESTCKKGGFRHWNIIQQVLVMKHNGDVYLYVDKLLTFTRTDKLPVVFNLFIHFRAGITELCSNLISKDFFS